MSEKFNLKNYKKTNGDDHIDMRLQEQHGNIPNVINEKQLEEYRATEPNQLVEKQLDRVRTGAGTKIVEKMLDSEKSKFANKYRNPSAYSGNVNKLEEKRLKNKPVEKEEYTAASETPKQLRWWENVKSPDGLKLAGTTKQIKVAQEETEEMTFDKPRWGEVEDEVKPDKIDQEDFDINDVVPADEIHKDPVMEIVKEKLLPNKDPALSAIYYVVSYDIDDFGSNEDKIKTAALSKILSTNPGLSGLISADDMSVREIGGEGVVSLRALGPEFEKVVNPQPEIASEPSVSKSPDFAEDGGFREISYKEENIDGTPMIIGRIRIDPDIEITMVNREKIIQDTLDFIRSKHSDLEIEEESLDLVDLNSGVIGFVVAAPINVTEAESDFKIVVADTTPAKKK